MESPMKTTSGGGFEMRALLASRYRHTYAQSVFDRSASFWRMASKVGFERICARSILVPGSISARRRSLSAASAASFGGEQTVAGWFFDAAGGAVAENDPAIAAQIAAKAIASPLSVRMVIGVIGEFRGLGSNAAKVGFSGALGELCDVGVICPVTSLGVAIPEAIPRACGAARSAK